MDEKMNILEASYILANVIGADGDELHEAVNVDIEELEEASIIDIVEAKNADKMNEEDEDEKEEEEEDSDEKSDDDDDDSDNDDEESEDEDEKDDVKEAVAVYANAYKMIRNKNPEVAAEAKAFLNKIAEEKGTSLQKMVNTEEQKMDTKMAKRKTDNTDKVFDDNSLPVTKAGLMAAFKEMADVDEKDMDAYGKMKQENMTAALKTLKKGKSSAKDILASYREEDQEEIEDVVKPENVEKKSQLPIKEALGDFFNGQELTEDFKNKTTILFESILKERLNEEVAAIEKEAVTAKEAYYVELKEALEADADLYLTHVAEEWLTENKLAVESGIIVEKAKDLITGMKALLAEHNIEMDAVEVDMVGGLQEEVSELNDSLTSVLREKKELQEELDGINRGVTLAKVAEGLTDTQVEKLEKLVEDVDYKSIEDFEKKATTLKEFYFKDGSTDTAENNDEVEVKKETRGSIYAKSIRAQNRN